MCWFFNNFIGPGTVSYTHLDVYKRQGIYYGQCSEFCGKDHSFMPIAVRVVSQEKFNNWLKLAKNNLDNAFRIMRYGS